MSGLFSREQNYRSREHRSRNRNNFELHRGGVTTKGSPKRLTPCLLSTGQDPRSPKRFNKPQNSGLLRRSTTWRRTRPPGRRNPSGKTQELPRIHPSELMKTAQLRGIEVLMAIFFPDGNGKWAKPFTKFYVVVQVFSQRMGPTARPKHCDSPRHADQIHKRPEPTATILPAVNSSIASVSFRSSVVWTKYRALESSSTSLACCPENFGPQYT